MISLDALISLTDSEQGSEYEDTSSAYEDTSAAYEDTSDAYEDTSATNEDTSAAYWELYVSEAETNDRDLVDGLRDDADAISLVVRPSVSPI